MRYYLLIPLLLLVACDRKRTAEMGSKGCIKVSVDGTECVYCRLNTESIAVSCNWSKTEPANIVMREPSPTKGFIWNLGGDRWKLNENGDGSLVLDKKDRP
jgi:hypothetical protein